MGVYLTKFYVGDWLDLSKTGTREVREWWQPIIITRFTAKSFLKTDPGVPTVGIIKFTID